jgi:hypothetical protein
MEIISIFNGTSNLSTASIQKDEKYGRRLEMVYPAVSKQIITTRTITTGWSNFVAK